jgi:adenylate cyclase
VTREFADLSATFQEMMEGLRERRHLSRFVSGALAADPLARASDGANSRRWYGTVLVSDIRRFTTLSESYPATEVMAMLNGHFDALAQEVQSRGGTIDKFIGDALVAVFFAQDEADRSHRRRAVETAVAMRERGRAIQEARRAAGKFPYDFGIGLASGELIGLTIGRSLQRWEHQVFGEAVRRAEVLEGLSKQARHTGIIADGAIAEETPEFGWVQLSAQNAWEMTGLPGGRS